MNPVITPETREVLKALHYRPAVSIIMPFEPKINLETELSHKLKVATDKVEQELLSNYPAEICIPVMRKLRTIIYNLNYNTHKKSVVIYVSLLFEKVIYLDIVAEEKIIIDGSFEIRDLVFNNKEQKKFLVLLLSPKECHLYAGNASELKKVEFNIPASVYDYVNDAPERMGNFSDMQEHKQIATYKLLYHIDSALDTTLSASHLPVFVLGTNKMLGHFKKFTKHSGAIIGYVHGNYDDASLPHLRQILESHIAAWNKVKQQELLDHLENAAGKNKLAAGIKEVWHEACNHRGALLVVEKDYTYVAQHGVNKDTLEEPEAPHEKVTMIRDAVDEVIEKILENGGDVEFVDKNLLNHYDHIALVQYY